MKFSVDGVEYELDEAKLTFGEARKVERVTGTPFAKLRHLKKTGDVGVEYVQAMVWIAMRRKKSDLEFSDLDDMAIGDVEFDNAKPAEEVAPSTDPTQAAAPAAPAGSPTSRRKGRATSGTSRTSSTSGPGSSTS